MLANRGKIISVTGPTCTGKSVLAMSLATRFGGEIINCDSMQVYRHFDIGTAKPDLSMRKSIPHHLIDAVEPDEEFNAARFQKAADQAIRDVLSRGRIPVLVGGTGLYLRALVYGLFEAPKDESLRARLQEQYTENPLGLYETLKGIDPDYAARISFKDKVRVVRAIEIYLLSRKKVSELEKDHGFAEPRYDTLKIGLTEDRDELYRRIDKRVKDMLDSGWIAEVQKILSMGVRESAKPFSSIGYREILLYVKGSIRFEDMVKDIQKSTRNYAKRQFTWFAKEKDMCWFRYPDNSEEIARKVLEFLK